jgi:SAM-dependent methyltransferase
MSLPDSSQWYTKERAMAEEVTWLLNQSAKVHLRFLLPRIEREGVKSVVEFGCGVGLVASGLVDKVDYIGIDSNPFFITRARNRLAGRPCFFYEADIRDRVAVNDFLQSQLSCAFFFLKNFGLHEWDQILAKLLSHGRFGCFDMQIAERDHDNGAEFHHVYLTQEHLERAVAAAGHKIVDREVQAESTVERLGLMREVMFWTQRVM